MPEVIFNPAAGRIRRVITNDNATPAMLAFPDLDYATYQVILTQSSLQTNPKYQATETLGGDVLLISFGESLGPIQISGFIFELACERPIKDGGGVSRLLKWWDTQNVTRRSTPIELSIGTSAVVRAFLGAIRVSVAEARDRIWKFQMGLMRIPPKRTVNERRFAAVDDPAAGVDSLITEDVSRSLSAVQNSAVSASAGTLNLDGSFDAIYESGFTPTGYDDPSSGLQNPLST